MKYIIIGLGNYGRILACDLTKLGNEVIGADIDESKVDNIKDLISTAFTMDSTDEHSLSILPFEEADVVIVAIGENFGASIKTVALLKHLKIEKIYARAMNQVHKSVLEAFNIEKILTPEEDAARMLVQMLDFGTNVEVFKIDPEYSIIKFKVPDSLEGYFVNKLSIQEEFNLKIIALKRARTIINSIGISITESDLSNRLIEDEKIQLQDELVCYGKYADFRNFWQTVS